MTSAVISAGDRVTFVLPTLIAAGFLGVLVGSTSGTAAIFFLIGICLGALLYIGYNHPTAFAGVAIASTFLSRPSIAILDFRLRIEMLVGLAALLCIVLRARSISISRRDASPMILLASWIIWSALITILVAPAPELSLTVVSWLILDWFIAFYIVCFVKECDALVYWGIALALAASCVGVILWMLATFSPIAILVQPDPTYGGFASYALVFEANILASLVCLWAMVAAMPRVSSHVPLWVRGSLVALTPLVAIATHTRVAMIASAIVLVVVLFTLRRLRSYLVFGGATVAALLASGVLNFSAVGLDKFSALLDFDGGTGRYRSLSWSQALSDISSPVDFFFGLGTNSFGQRHFDPSLPGLSEPWYLGNMPLQIIYDTGLVGGLLLLVAFVLSLPRRISVSVAGFVCIYLIFGVSTSTLWLAQGWIFFAMALVYRRKGETGETTVVSVSADSNNRWN